ncbi:MAG: outer membrane lipoprotein carrier protein LolA [Mariprofundaceae bacterium]
MTRLLSIWLLSLMLGVSTSYADTLPEELPKNLNLGLQKLEDFKGFSCQFEQFISFEDGSYQRYQGSLSIRRPGQFRWQYQQPYEQLFVSKGQGVWHYEADLMQAQWFKDFDALDPVAMRLLDGRIKSKDVKLLDKAPLLDDGYVYHLRVLKTLEIFLAFNEGSDLLWLETLDVLGNRNRIVLLELNNQIPDEKVFDFTPAEGVDVVDAPTSVLN